MNCLHCKKDFQEKRPTAKFCSTSCRVMYNRKHGKKNPITKTQLQVVYNAILDLLAGDQKDLPKSFQNIKEVGVLTEKGNVEALSFEKMKQQIQMPINNFDAQKIMRKFWDEKRELDTDSYTDWVERLMSSPLSTRQKELVKNTYQ